MGLGELQAAWRWPSTETSDLKHKLRVHQAWQEEVEHTSVSENKAQAQGKGRACMMTIGSLLGSGCSLGQDKGEVSLSLSGGQQPWSGLLFPLAPLRLEPRHVLPADSAVISCFESEGPGLNILLASFNLNRELAITVFSFPKLPPLGAPMASFPGVWGGQKSKGQAGW